MLTALPIETDEVSARALQGVGKVCSERAGRMNEAFSDEFVRR